MTQQVLYIGDWKVPKLIKYDVEYNKLWGDDSGRDMLGTNKGSLIGFYPKIYVQVGSFTQDEMRTFLQVINKEEVSISYYEEQYGKILENLPYYVNDYKISVKNLKKMTYNSFEFNLIPNKKRKEQ